MNKGTRIGWLEGMVECTQLFRSVHFIIHHNHPNGIFYITQETNIKIFIYYRKKINYVYRKQSEVHWIELN
jgi:hypothetical protein